MFMWVWVCVSVCVELLFVCMCACVCLRECLGERRGFVFNGFGALLRISNGGLGASGSSSCPLAAAPHARDRHLA